MTGEKNKKKFYGITRICAAAVTLLAVASAIVFGVLTPSKKSFTEVAASSGDATESEISALVQGYVGEEYFIIGNAAFEKRRASDDKLLKKVDYKAEITAFATERELVIKKGGLETFFCKYVTVTEDERYLLVVDGVGNMFKYVDGDDMVLSEDYYLTDKNYYYLEEVNDGADIYTLFNQANGTELRKFDVRSLKSGVNASRYIWNVSSVSDDAYTLSLSNTNVKRWAISVTDEYVYLALSNGLYKIAKDFSDFGDLLFFEEAEKQYSDNYLNLLRVKADEFGAEYGEDTTYSELEKILKEQKVSTGELSAMKKTARSTVVDDNEWCDGYSGTEIIVNANYFDYETYAHVKYGGNAPFGVAYAGCNDTFYILGDDAVYALSAERLGEFDSVDDRAEDAWAKVDLSLDGRTFDLDSSVAYNEFSACLYITYANTDYVSIVDVKEQPTILYTFKAVFDIQKQIGDADNDTYHYLALSAATKKLYVYGDEPAKSLHASLYNSLFVASVVTAIVALVITIVALYGYKSDKGAAKLAFIKKDLIKNKGVYIALLPFIVLICMFCYYEAVGSISFSFYEYTQAKPTKNWNNFANYRTVIGDPAFWGTVKNMLFFLVFDIIFAIVPPMIFAFMLSIMRGKKYSKFMRTALFIPGILPGVATMLVWRIGIFGDSGVLNGLFKLFGATTTVDFLHNKDIATWALLLMGFPFVGSYLIFYGGMMNVPSSYYEAAELDGVTVMKRLFKIDIPLIASQIKYVFITTFISSVQNYARTFMLGADSKTPVHNLYEKMQEGDYGVASAYAVLIFVFLLAAMIINFRSQKKELEGSL